MLDVLSTCVGLLFGVAIGAGGKYLADVFTDQRKRQEAAKTQLRAFNALAAQMPELFRAIKTDLEADGQQFTREVFLLPSPRSMLSGFETKAYFCYDNEQHAALEEKFDLLKHEGLVTDIAQGNTPHFRLAEPFVVHLLRWRAD